MHEGYQDGSDGDNSDSDSSSTTLSSDWDEVAEDLWTDVQCLLDLDPPIESPAPDIVHISVDKPHTPANWKPHVAFSDNIRFRFPSADPSVVDRLARANWERFLKGKVDREKNQNLVKSPVAKQTGMENAGTVARNTEPVSKFHDSGLGASINTRSAYAETVMSYRRSGGESVRIPPLPEEAKQGKPFECCVWGDFTNVDHGNNVPSLGSNNGDWRCMRCARIGTQKKKFRCKCEGSPKHMLFDNCPKWPRVVTGHCFCVWCQIQTGYRDRDPVEESKRKGLMRDKAKAPEGATNTTSDSSKRLPSPTGPDIPAPDQKLATNPYGQHVHLDSSQVEGYDMTSGTMTTTIGSR